MLYHLLEPHFEHYVLLSCQHSHQFFIEFSICLLALLRLVLPHQQVCPHPGGLFRWLGEVSSVPCHIIDQSSNRFP